MVLTRQAKFNLDVGSLLAAIVNCNTTYGDPSLFCPKLLKRPYILRTLCDEQ